MGYPHASIPLLNRQAIIYLIYLLRVILIYILFIYYYIELFKLINILLYTIL
jgi:hypothetical protein